MIRLPSICKVAAVLALDFLALCTLSGSASIAAVITGVITLYVWLGGHLSLLREGAMRCEQLPAYERSRLETAKAQLEREVKHSSSVSISGLSLYLIPGNANMNATAYGGNCVSVTQGTLDNIDPVTLNAVLLHEVSHILSFDAEFNRAVFCSITLLIGAISVVSALAMVIIFLIFLLLSCFRSWLGVLVFSGTTKAVGGIFSLVQRGIVVVYRTLLGFINRRAEYRSDLYSCSLGYGLQLAHFLAIAGSESDRRLTLTDALYRSHPPTEKRIACLQRHLRDERNLESKGC